MIPTKIPGFSLRTATADDAGLIIDFIKKLAVYEKLLDKVVITEENILIYLFGDRPYAEITLAYLETHCIGFAVYFHNFSTFAGKPGLYLEDVFIDPEQRGKGYGREILRYLAKTALDRGCARFEWSVLDWNTPSIEFYLSLGAKPMDEWTVFRMEEKEMETFLGNSQ